MVFSVYIQLICVYFNFVLIFCYIYSFINNNAMLTLNLNPIFKARGIERPYTFLVKAGLTPHTANVLLNSKTKVFRLDHIEKLCVILRCEPNDLLVWNPSKNEIIADDHPLTKLKQGESPSIDLRKTLLNMPYDKLKSLSSKLTEEGKENEM